MRRFIEDFKKAAIKCLTIDTDGKLSKRKIKCQLKFLPASITPSAMKEL